MIIFVYGSDGYRLKQVKEDYINRYKAKYQSGVNSFSFDFSETSNLGDLDDATRSFSFFNEHKLLVCSNSFSNKIIAEKIFSFLKEQKVEKDPSVTFLAVDNLPEKDLLTKHKELFKLLSAKDNIVKAIASLEGTKLFKWIKNEFQVKGCQVQNEVVKKLVEVVGNDSWMLSNEINKLASYSSWEEVKLEHIKLLTSQTVDLNIFDLIDAIAQKNKLKAYELLYQELESGQDPYYILTMIIYQFRNLLTVKGLQEQGLSQADIAKKAKLHPFVVKKTLKSPFQLEEISLTHSNLLNFDNGFKMGKTNLEDSLYGLII